MQESVHKLTENREGTIMEDQKQTIYYEDEETEINIASLMAALLRSWKTIIIWGIIFCLIGAAFQAYRTRQDEEANEEALLEYNWELKNYNEALNSYKRERAAVQADIDDIYNYIDQSMLLKINPYKEAYATADLLFDVEDEGYSVALGDKVLLKNMGSDRVLGAYKSFLDNSISYKKIAAEYGIEDRFVRELVSYDSSQESNGTLRVYVRHTDQKEAMRILDYVLAMIEKQKDSFAKNTPEHSYTVINKSVRERVDTGLVTAIEELKSGTTVVKNVNSLYSRQLDKVDEYNVRLKEINEKIESLSEPLSVEAGQQRGILKFALLGFLGGLVLGVILRALRLIMGGKLLDRQPLMQSFGLHLLAAFPHGKNDVFNRLADRILVAETGLTPDEAQIVAVNSIRRITGNERQSILLAAGKEMNVTACRALRDGLSEKDSRNTYTLVSAFGNNLHTQQGLEESDGVILLAEISKTRQETIANIMHLAKQYGKSILGVLLFN